MNFPPDTLQISFDVKYYDDDFAVVGCAAFQDHKSTAASETGQIIHYGVEPYESGVFYKRELPCLLHAIEALDCRFEVIYIDAYVWLGGDKNGLGYHLFEALGNTTPVIGISKTRYFGQTDLIREVIRKTSGTPLYVSAVGIDLNLAAQMVAEMAGEYRIPDLIKLADTMSRKAVS